MLISVVRSLILYLSVVASLRIMGKRQIGELQPSELVVAIMISDLATVPMSETAIPLLYGIVPIITLVLAEMTLSYLCLKIPLVRSAFTGRPNYIIKDGIIVQREMKKARYSIADLLEELRMQGVYDISTVERAILETNGKISVLTKDNCKNLAFVLICDGKIQERILADSPFNQNDLLKFIGGRELCDIFLLSVDKKKKIYCVIKE